MSDAEGYDVAIIGGGLVGASLARGLLEPDSGNGTVKRIGRGPTVLLVDAVAPGSASHPSFDERTTALGNGSRRIFQGLNIWRDIALEAAAIRSIHISDAGRFGFARLTAADHGVEALGYVVPNRVIGAALWKHLQSSRLTVRAPARADAFDITPDAVRFQVVSETGAVEHVSARLLVAADGAQSTVREAAGIPASVEDYRQLAIVANVMAERPNDGTAYERFTPAGPFAVLPLRDGSYTVIWSSEPERATQLIALDDAAYLAEMQKQFGWRAGRFVRVGKRASYPLKLTRAATTVGTRTVLIGNAAQALHPVAGQGFNLGLRDAAMLAEVIVNAPDTEDVGSPELLKRFTRWRAADRRGVVGFTDGLVKLFGSRVPGVGLLRDVGLLMLDLTPPAKGALARLSIGLSGPTPRLARGLPVRSNELHTTKGAPHGG